MSFATEEITTKEIIEEITAEEAYKLYQKLNDQQQIEAKALQEIYTMIKTQAKRGSIVIEKPTKFILQNLKNNGYQINDNKITWNKEQELTKFGYKFLTNNMQSPHNDKTQWVLNEWKIYEGSLELCMNGFHYCKDPYDALMNHRNVILCQVEVYGEEISDDTKTVTKEMRVIKVFKNIKEICVRFVIECAERRLSVFENEYKQKSKLYQIFYTEDLRPREAIKAAKAWLADQSEENQEAAYKLYSSICNANELSIGIDRSAGSIATNVAYSIYSANAVHSAHDIANSTNNNEADEEWQRKTFNEIIAEYGFC